MDFYEILVLRNWAEEIKLLSGIATICIVKSISTLLP